MRRLRLVILLLLFVPMLHAQHYLGVALDAALSGEVDDIESTRSMLGGAGAVHAVYNLQVRHFIMQTGLVFKFTGVGQAVDTILHSDYKIYDLQCTAYRPEIRVPLQMGVAFNRFYTMVGADVAKLFNGSSRQKGLYSVAKLESDKYFPDLNETLNNFPVESKRKLWSTLDVHLSMEIGAMLPKSYLNKEGPEARIAAYAEYGLMNTLPHQSQSLVIAGNDANSFTNVEIEHIHTTYAREDFSKHDWSVGIRFTLLFKVSGTYTRYNPDCRCLE